MANKVLQTEFRAKDSGLIAEMKAAGASADVLKRKMLELKNAGSKGGEKFEGGGIVKDLKAGLGARSNLGQLGKALKGGGAILGLTLIAGELAKAAANAKDLKEQFDAGKISGGAMVESLAKGLPIIGGFITAGRDIKDLLASFDGLANSGFGKLIGLDDLNYAAKINKELAVTKAVDDYVASTLERQKNLLKSVLEERTRIAQEAGKVGLKGNAAADYDRQVTAQNRLTEVEKKRADALAESDKARNAAMGEVRKDKDMSPAMAFAAEQQIQKRANEDKKKIQEAFDAEMADTQKLNQKEDSQANFESGHKMMEFWRDVNRERIDNQKTTDANRLKEMGDSLGSELILIEKNAADKKAAIDKETAQKSEGASGDDTKAFKQAGEEQKAAIDAAAASEARLARKAQQEEAVKTLQDGQLAVLRQQADSGDEMAKADLQRLEAAKATNDEHKKLLDLLKQQLTPAERAAALAQLTALKTADHAGILKQLNDQQTDALKAQSENGDTAAERRDAKKKLEALELTKRYNEQAAKAAAIIKNPASTAEDRAAATANLKSYASTLAKEFDKEVGNQGNPLKKTADLQERGLLVTGVAAAARAQSDPANITAKASVEAVKLQQQANTQFEQFVEWSKSQAAKSPTVVFGVAD